jgi:hypothetical protein
MSSVAVIGHPVTLTLFHFLQKKTLEWVGTKMLFSFLLNSVWNTSSLYAVSSFEEKYSLTAFVLTLKYLLTYKMPTLPLMLVGDGAAH